MNPITILDKDNNQRGPYTVHQVQAMLASGEITPSTLAFTAGLSQWTPVKKVIARATTASSGNATSSASSAAAATSYSDYAGFWLRVVAVCIDGVVLLLLTFGLFYLMYTNQPGWMAEHAAAARNLNAAFHGHHAGTPFSAYWQDYCNFFIADWRYQITMLAFQFLYFPMMESSPLQGTFGKICLGLVVTDTTGARIGIIRATVRWFAKFFSALPCLLGYVLAGITRQKQAVHDFIAGTLVMRR